MARYFLHLRGSMEETLDDEGVDYPNIKAVQKAALRGVRAPIAGEIKSTGLMDLRCRLDAENDISEIVYTLPFAQAWSIIPAP